MSRRRTLVALVAVFTLGLGLGLSYAADAGSGRTPHRAPAVTMPHGSMMGGAVPHAGVIGGRTTMAQMHAAMAARMAASGAMRERMRDAMAGWSGGTMMGGVPGCAAISGGAPVRGACSAGP